MRTTTWCGKSVGINNVKILVLGLGNELVSDDGAGILVTRMVKEPLQGQADVVESALSGLALLDLFLGYDRAIIVDAIMTGAHPVGAIVEIDAEAISALVAPSPHYTGLPEMLSIADQLQLPFPRVFCILGLEVADLVTFGGEITPAVRDALPALAARICEQVRRWQAEEH